MSAPAPTPSSGSTSSGSPVQPAPGWAWITLMAIVLLFLVLGIRGCVQDKAKGEEKSRVGKISPPSATVKTVEVLEKRFDGPTPCSPSIDYKFELDTQGDPIILKFPGIREPIEYSGKGTIKIPERRTSGPVQITSKDPRKEARVRIWEVVKIQRKE